MNNSIKISLENLTPIWTGDADGHCNELKLTGIIGSLRWWFEVLVRGMGYYACDPTLDDKCKVDIEKFDYTSSLKIYEQICPVCYLFGTTGWKSRFSLYVTKSNLNKPYNGKITVKMNGRNAWHYESGLIGEVILNFQYNEFYLEDGLKFSGVFSSILKILLYLIQEYGMLGAKTSMGYGVVRFKINDSHLSIDKNDWKNFEKYLELFKIKFHTKHLQSDANDEKRKTKIENNLKNLPNLKDIFFVKFTVISNDFDDIFQNIKPFYRFQDRIIEEDIDKWKDKGWLISSPVVRKELRIQIKYRFTGNDNLRHFLMGKVKGQNSMFSAIQVSHVYTHNENFEFRIYGWLPDKGPVRGKVEDILELLTMLFKDVPWKKKYNQEEKKELKFLPSQIQSGICWQDDKLILLQDKQNIELLFELEDDI